MFKYNTASYLNLSPYVVKQVAFFSIFTTKQLTMGNQSIPIYKPEPTKCYNLAFGTNHDTSYNFSNEESTLCRDRKELAYFTLAVLVH